MKDINTMSLKYWFFGSIIPSDIEKIAGEIKDCVAIGVVMGSWFDPDEPRLKARIQKVNDWYWNEKSNNQDVKIICTGGIPNDLDKEPMARNADVAKKVLMEMGILEKDIFVVSGRHFFRNYMEIRKIHKKAKIKELYVPMERVVWSFLWFKIELRQRRLKRHFRHAFRFISWPTHTVVDTGCQTENETSYELIANFLSFFPRWVMDFLQRKIKASIDPTIKSRI